MNKSIVTFTRGTLAQATPLWQYDYGQVLEINGLDLPATYQVHFCNCSDSQTITVLGNADGVLIPDNLLQTGKTVIAYIYLHTGADDGETEYKITIPVRPRPAPSDIPPTPEQQSALDEAIAALNSAVEDVEDIADGIPDQINAALEEAKESGEFDGPPGPQGPAGPQGESGTPGNSIWKGGAVRTSGTTPYYFLSDLSGRTDVSPAAGDLIVSNIFWLWQIKRISGQTVYLTSLGSIKGETGADGEDGYSPTVTVTEISGGHRVTITDAEGDHAFDVLDGQGGGGTGDYNDLTNQPQINGTTLSGNKTAADLDLEPEAMVVTVTDTGGNVLHADKNAQQIYEAFSAGMRVVAYFEGMAYTLVITDERGIQAIFSSVLQGRIYYLSVDQNGNTMPTSWQPGSYSKPSGGIPKTDLASAVQTSLGKADTALQPGDVAEPFFVTYSTSDMTTWTCDKTFAQITAAMAAGKQVVMLASVAGTPIVQACSFVVSPSVIQAWVRIGQASRYSIQHLSDNSVIITEFTESAQWLGAVPENQGVSHAGEFLVVGSDGDVTTMTLSTWSAGSY